MISKSITSSISRSISSSISDSGDSGVSISESFAKSDGTGLGPDLTWRTYEETWRTTSGRAKTTSNGSATAYATKSLGSPRHNAETVVVTHDDSNDNVGVMLRNDGSTDGGYAVVFQRTGTTTGLVRVFTRITGSFSAITDWVPVVHPKTTFRLAGSADGNVIKGFIDGYVNGGRKA